MERRPGTVDQERGAVGPAASEVVPRARRRGSRWATALLVPVGALLPACARASETTSSTSVATTAPIPFPVPHGWTTYSFGRFTTGEEAIAVPSSWAVQRDVTCPTGDGPGELILDVQGSAFCSVSHYPQGVVAVGPPDGRTGASTEPSGRSSVAIDGPTRDMIGGVPWTIWSAPSLGILINATGPYARQVVHTLHQP